MGTDTGDGAVARVFPDAPARRHVPARSGSVASQPNDAAGPEPRDFATRLTELFAAAGSPPTTSVAHAANARVREGTPQLTEQRISDWRGGRCTPMTFVAVLPVLEMLMARAKGRMLSGHRVDTTLLDTRHWHELWRAAMVETGSIDTEREPYRGLWPYRVEDSDLFFGRNRAKHQLHTLISRVESSNTINLALLVGPTGVGKSSLLAAGLQGAPGPRIPIVMTPGHDPIATLESKLDGLPPGRRLLLVDQGEELFSQCSDETQRHGFLIELAALAAPGASSPTTVVFAIDTAHLPELSRYPVLMAALRDRSMMLDPMTQDELRDVIVQPAAVVGVRVDHSLVEVLLQDLAAVDVHSPVRLPLLSFVLTTTWANRRGKTLALAAYREAGGMEGACAYGGEVFWSRLDARQQAAARHLLLALTITGPTAVLRNRMPIEVLLAESPDPEATRAVLARLTKLRMIVQRNDDIELAHDQLLSGWPRLAEWLSEEKEFAPARQRIEADAREWAAQDRPEALLYAKTRLADAVEWMARTQSSNRLAKEFVAVSMEKGRRRAVRRRWILAGVATLVVVALGSAAAVVAQRASIAQQRKDVWLGAIVAESERLETIDPGLSAELALAAYRINPDDPGARARLLAAQVTPLDVTSAAAHEGPVRKLAFSPNRNLLASAGSDGMVRLWDMADPRAITPVAAGLGGHRGDVQSVVFAPDGNTLASAGDDGTLRIWDVANRAAPDELGSFDTGTPATAVVYLPEGHVVVVAGTDGTLSLVNVDVPQAMHRVTPPIPATDKAIRAIAIAPDRPVLASAADDGTVRLWSVRETGLTPIGPPLDGEGGRQTVEFGPNDLLATGSADGVLQVWDVRDPAHPHRIDAEQARRVPVAGMAFAADGQVLLAADADGTARVWNMRHRDRITPTGWEIHGASGSIQSILVVSETQVVTAGTDGRIRAWRAPQVQLPLLFDGSLSSVGFGGAGNLVVSGLRDGAVGVWDASSPRLGRALSEIDAGTPGRHGTQVALRSDDKLLATVGSGDVRLWNLADPAKPVPIGQLPGAGVTAPLAFTSRGDRLLTGVGGRSLQMWDVSDPSGARPLGKVLPGYDREITVAALSPGGSRVAAANDNRRIDLWDIANSDEPVSIALDSHGSNLRTLVFSPDGTRLFGGDDTGMIRSWDVTDPRRVRELGAVRGHTATVRTLAIDKSGRRLASGGDDRTARLWNIDDVAAITPLSTPINVDLGWTWFLRFDPRDESRLLGIGDKTSAELYVEPDQVATYLCASSAPRIDDTMWRELFPSVPYTPPCS
ncbi:nSTAND1 domain-containing NTPase [Nocardia altamirensis]|uniref:nSTAND1 domain-containing NTPase n=1 Tax=Nocardia altamirensis TaxID=472158 RepID=UPI0009FE4F88|nr:hypothetical protein [Nocardia altamirensis]